ncbi:DEAD/DEAH box helicase [Microbacterium sp. AR7-10]|uniref:DEAD/DEAH box helicase n=1 Tax=Microbacterium sp. AR7-10 TaxID=1891970 RepID=UPI0008FCADBF|nr:DEAD/DEAH box helicase [Microbacterium sp. AR7-10]OIU88052.1 RNA helicase [Microbacterium sp. AR7-10]
MPKNGKPKGGRPSRNFEPRYAKSGPSFHERHSGGRPSRDGDRRTDGAERRSFSSDARADRRPGSVSPKHRGYRPTDAEGSASKGRWSDTQRAGRDEARSIRNRAESGRREAPHHRGDRDDRGGRGFERNDRFGRDARPARDDRFGRDARPARDDRFGRDARPARDDRFGRDARPARDDRGGYERRERFDRDARPARDDRGNRGFDRSERPARNERGGFDRRGGVDRDARPARNGRFDREARPARDERSGYAGTDRFDRDARPARDERRGGSDRPRFDRDARPERGGRFDRDTRPARTDRFDRDARPARDDRRGGFERSERPRFDRDARPARQNRDARPNRSDWNATSTAKAHDEQVDVVHERLEAEAVQATEVADVTFGDLGIGSNIVEILKNMGAATPFPIQAATIPSILQGRDVLGRGRTGSGKTIAFGAPLVESILLSQKGTRREFGRKPRAIILAPTRELALQIDRTVQPIARSVGLFTTQIYGGVPQARQVGALNKGVDIIIGTPGRIEDLIEQRKLDLSEVRIAVLDEADHMAELGFAEPVQRILRKTGTALPDGATSQKLLFSATLDREVAAIVDEFLVDPAVYEVAGEDQDSSTIDHRVLVIEHRDKADVLTSLVDRDGQTLVFARTRAYAEMLAEQFEDAGIAAVSLHGDLNQAKRTRNLQKLTAGKVQVLVATDVAARGIHVDDIDLVVQADAPDEYKTYLHRSGRTGRAGRSGRVVTLITRQRRRRMEDLLGRAEIDAPFEQAAPGDDVIEEIAGRMLSEAELTA